MDGASVQWSAISNNKKWTIDTSRQMNLKDILQSGGSQSEWYDTDNGMTVILTMPIYMTFWKRQNYNDRTDQWLPGAGGGA